MMNGSIVKQLADWVSSRGPRLRLAGVEVDSRIPEPSSSFPWKASVGLIKDDILVGFTVWERTIFQTQLIIMDGASREELVFKDANPENVEEINEVLDSVAEGLVKGTYRRAKRGR